MAWARLHTEWVVPSAGPRPGTTPQSYFGPVAMSVITKLIYIIVGLAAIYLIYPLYMMLAGRPAERPIVRP